MLRESHDPALADGFKVVLEVSHLKKLTVDLLYSFVEIWLLKNCKSPWDLSLLEEISTAPDHHTRTILRIVFKDVREALYFKLSPHALYNKPEPHLFLLSFCNDSNLSL